MRTRRFAALSIALCLMVLGACGSGDSTAELAAPAPASQMDQPSEDASEETRRSLAQDGGDTSGGSGAGGSGPFAGATAGGSGDAGSPGVPDIGVPGLPIPTVPGSSRVIKNIALQIRIDDGDFQRQFARVGTIAEQFGGFVTSSQVSETDGELASGTLTLRVPVDRFEQAVARMKDLGKVTAEDRSGQDVTKEFVDLEARLKQAKTEEAFYLRLMDQTETISDMIQVQSHLSGVQLRIESIQGQLNYLNDQTSFSSISVRLYEPGAEEAGLPKGLAKAWEEAIRGFQSVIGGLVVALGWLAPFVLIGLVALAVYRLRSRPEKPAEAGPESGA